MLKGLLLVSIMLFAASHADTWDRTYGSDLPEQAFFSLVTEDGGILTCGLFVIDVSYSIVSSDGPGGLDCMLVRTDSDNEILWQRDYYSGPWPDLGVAGVQTDDGCFVIAGVTTTMEEGQQNWIFKVDDEGEIVWDKSIGTDFNDWTYDMIHTVDGGFLLVGYVDSLNGTGTVVNVLRTDEEGSELWNRQYGEAGSGMAEAQIETANGDFLIIGPVEDAEAGVYAAPFIMRIDSEGNQLWMEVFSGKPGNCYPIDMAEITGGNIIMTGYAETVDGDYDVWAALVTPDGELLDEWTYGGKMDDMAFSVTPCDEGCVIAGSTESEGSGRADLWIFCIDPSGEVIWSETHGGPGNESAEDIMPAPGGGFILSGYTSTWGAGDTDIWVLRVDEEGRMD